MRLEKSASFRTLPSLYYWTNFHCSFIKNAHLNEHLEPYLRLYLYGTHSPVFQILMLEHLEKLQVLTYRLIFIFFKITVEHLFCQKYTFCKCNFLQTLFEDKPCECPLINKPVFKINCVCGLAPTKTSQIDINLKFIVYVVVPKVIDLIINR